MAFAYLRLFLRHRSCFRHRRSLLLCHLSSGLGDGRLGCFLLGECSGCDRLGLFLPHGNSARKESP